MNQPYPISAFEDNYIWLVSNNRQAYVVDPGQSKPVLEELTKRQLELAGILITHWHNDHIGGVNELLEHYEVPVYGPKSDHIPQVTHALADGDLLSTPFGEFKVFEVPGHTMDHIAYYNESSKQLYCGDTLFSAGCGRMFEGTPEVFYDSLSKLASLPEDTDVFCTHEYTLANLKFANAVEPTNQDILNHQTWSEQQRNNNKPTLPSSIGLELKINPFIRTGESSVIDQALNQGAINTDPVNVFATLREWKNNF